MDPLPERVRLVAAPGALRDVELGGVRVADGAGETVVSCRLVDGSVGTIPARWTDLPAGRVGGEPLGVDRCRRRGGGVVASGRGGCGRGVRVGAEPPVKTEVRDVGTARAGSRGEVLVAAAVWETLPPERQREVTIQLARLLARLVEAERDE